MSGNSLVISPLYAELGIDVRLGCIQAQPSVDTASPSLNRAIQEAMDHLVATLGTGPAQTRTQCHRDG